MKKLLFVLLLLPGSLLAQNLANAIGVVMLDQSTYARPNDMISIYNEDGSIYVDFTLFMEGDEHLPAELSKNFAGLALFPENFIFMVSCLGMDESWYYVSLNDGSGEVKYIKRSPSFKLISWPDYFMNAYGIGFDPVANPVRDDIDGPPQSPTAAEGIPFQPLAIRGEWIYVRWTSGGDYPEDEAAYFYGWTRWKEGNKLLAHAYHVYTPSH